MNDPSISAPAAVSEPRDCDVFLMGAGPAGLTAAILLARAGLSVIAVERARPSFDPVDPGADLRTTALLQPSIEILVEIGVWDVLEPQTEPLRAMRLIEAEGDEGAARVEADFNAAELDREAFGANVANTDLRGALWAAAERTEGLELIAPARPAQVLLRQDAALIRLEDGRRFRAPLAVGADGKESALRAAAGLSALRHDYAQDSMAFVVAHERPHEGVSTEILVEGGPFTLVPFTADPETGAPRSSVVWMAPRAEAGRLMSLSAAEFEAAAEERSRGVLGKLRLVSRRARWPAVTLLASRFHARRAALIAEAAHATPPIGAQGLNMSLQDAKALRDILAEARQAGRDIGEEKALARLTRARYSDVVGRLAATAALNGAAIGAAKPIRDLRRLGLALIHGAGPLRKAAMRFGLG